MADVEKAVHVYAVTKKDFEGENNRFCKVKANSACSSNNIIQK